MSLSRQLFRDPRLFDIEEVMAELSYMPTIRTYIRNSISEVVWGSSILQTIQGLLSAGVVRSVRYAVEKLKKGREGSPPVVKGPPIQTQLPQDQSRLSEATPAQNEDIQEFRERVKQQQKQI